MRTWGHGRQADGDMRRQEHGDIGKCDTGTRGCVDGEAGTLGTQGYVTQELRDMWTQGDRRTGTYMGNTGSQGYDRWGSGAQDHRDMR